MEMLSHSFEVLKVFMAVFCRLDVLVSESDLVDILIDEVDAADLLMSEDDAVELIEVGMKIVSNAKPLSMQWFQPWTHSWPPHSRHTKKSDSLGDGDRFHSWLAVRASSFTIFIGGCVLLLWTCFE